MSFIEFYFILFPAILIIFYITRYFSLYASRLILLFSSMAFLLYVDTLSFFILLFLVFTNFTLIHFMRQGFNKTLLRSFGVLSSLLPLILYKFSIVETTTIQSGTVLSLVIPLGLAFYALQQITALFDATKNNNDTFNFQNYLLFSFFFIYLPSGPLTPYKTIVPQFEAMKTKKIPLENINMGFSLFIVGFAKKTMLADPISEWINAFYAIEQNIEKEIVFSIFELSYIAWGSTLQFYFEFSAYSDMAIGMALCFGLLLPVNFNSPLKAKNAMEYINSWHMSIMAFLKEYVFQPAFMVLKRIPIVAMEARYIISWAIAVFLTYALVGIWHAPTETSVYYSVLVAFIIILIEVLKKIIHLPFSFKLMGLESLVPRVFFLFIIIFTFIIFRAPENLDFLDFFIGGYSNFYVSVPSFFSDLFPDILSSYIYYDGAFPAEINLISLNVSKPLLSSKYAVIHIIIATVIVFTMPNSMNMFKLIQEDKFTLFQIYWKDTNIQALILAVLFFISLTLFTNNTGFVYG